MSEADCECSATAMVGLEEVQCTLGHGHEEAYHAEHSSYETTDSDLCEMHVFWRKCTQSGEKGNEVFVGEMTTESL